MTSAPERTGEKLYVAGINYGPYDGGFTPMGVYSTEEAAWAALGRGRHHAANEVAEVILNAPLKSMEALK
jgi:hypothetical protein